MSLSDLASLGSFVSGVAVLGSLVFLYFQLRQLSAQIRQAERNQQASIRTARTTREVDWQLAVTTEPSVSAAFRLGRVGSQDISEIQLDQFMGCARALFIHAEDSFYQHTEGLLNKAAFDTFVASVNQVMRNPGFRVAWKRFRVAFAGDFQNFMDQRLSNLPVGTPLTSLSQWKIDVTAELGGTAS